MSTTRNLLSDLSYNFEQLLESGDNYDVLIQAGENPDMREFRAHSIILSTRSPYFRAALSNNWARKRDGIIVFKKSNICPDIFKLLLKYLYTAKVDLETLEELNVLKLLTAADELDLQKLIEYVQSYLFDKKNEFLTDNHLEILKIIFRHEELSKLRDFCLDRLAEDPGVLFKSPNFYTIDKSLLHLILQQENLAIDEMEICKFMIQWTITQSSKILNIENILELSSEDLSTIKGSLQDFIPLIRWFQISKENFLKFQKLLKIILPPELYESIKKFNFKKEIENQSIILPPRFPYIDSKLLRVEHFAMISSWIDRNNTQIYKSQFPYKFKLLYRASENGFEVENFHLLCDKKGPTVTISKFARNGKIIGGYNPLDWRPQNEPIENTAVLNYHSWWATSESFLFCFENKKTSTDSQWAKFARVASVHSAVCYNRHLCGPAFGPGWDLVIGERYKHASCWGSTGYPESRLFFNSTEWNAVHHELEDYEVFQVINKY